MERQTDSFGFAQGKRLALQDTKAIFAGMPFLRRGIACYARCGRATVSHALECGASLQHRQVMKSEPRSFAGRSGATPLPKRFAYLTEAPKSFAGPACRQAGMAWFGCPHRKCHAPAKPFAYSTTAPGFEFSPRKLRFAAIAIVQSI